ncbi:ATP-dependent DNA helicase RecG [Faecalibacterium prausnitzii]|uniref:ATP-dependent DNA helicase RecG n=1 Tax=Faecalibacterium prausnitzii TaxID=853 RepID=A0AAX1QF64_9FIRM|nr:ATP-dependent DNA helicase RecG [Faecalibacterium prausnitzii]AXA82597.1 ATP-dependent DNA helicase RecG [Faecalibacterium prausnitzii]RAW48240.1 ATP-dependent DNA helicase RecG [Faecalibacterium prausnitzii]
MPAELHTTLTPDTPVRYLKGVGPKTAERFEKLGILTLSDLLCHYPRRYLDFSKPYSIAEAPADTECVVKAEVFAKPGGRILPGGRRMERITAGDDVSSLEITWFNNPYAAQKLELGQEYYFQGIVTGGMLRRQMVNPQVRTDAQVKSSPFEAVYPQTEGLTSSAIAKCVRQLLPHAELLPDPLPSEMLKKYRLLSKADAVRAIHCPATEEEAFAARRRLIYEELLVLQLGIGRMKNHGAAATGAPMKKADASPFWESLSFSPTGAQRRAVEEILTDMSGETSMNRLLQGDVGSGKTLVAAAAIWACIRAGYQAALLAPTEILASQHAENLNRLLSPFGMRVALLTGGMKAAARRTTLAAIRDDEADLIVGTHAILSEGVEFARLGLAVVDEQHRFGVRQRGLLAEKAANPHLLVMSATPIPRTLGLLMYGDLDISILDELPPGRKPVKTRCITGKKRADLYGFLDREIDSGRQVYIVCPAIEDAGGSGLNAVKSYYEDIAKAYLPDRRVGLMHGKLKPKEKAEVMDDFKSGRLDALVSTTVIEVGVDVPNATVMVIENAERYGLSALHQLRGRVGRGAAESWCFLVSDNASESVQKRLKFLCSTSDGFAVAQYDLETRGPGDFFGSRQHGLPTLQIADLMNDTRTLHAAQSEAVALLAEDPLLERPEHALLARQVEQMFDKAGTMN